MTNLKQIENFIRWVEGNKNTDETLVLWGWFDEYKKAQGIDETDKTDEVEQGWHGDSGINFKGKKSNTIQIHDEEDFDETSLVNF